MKPSARAERERQALKTFLSTFEASVAILTGTSLGEDSGSGIERTTVINVIVSTDGDKQRAERTLMEAVGAADSAWVRWRGSSDLDLERATRQVIHRKDHDENRRLDLALRTAIGRADDANALAVEREKSWSIRTLAWFARLPDEVAEVAGVDHQRAGKTIGRVFQFLIPGGTLTGLGALIWKLLS